jgi:hypothetical protein
MIGEFYYDKHTNILLEKIVFIIKIIFKISMKLRLKYHW